MPSQQGYDRAITVFSPDGRLYQVEYAIETVKRGSIALGIKTKDGIVFAADESPRKLQIVAEPQKLFKIDQHIGVAAAGYIPDARSQVDDARFFSQSNKIPLLGICQGMQMMGVLNKSKLIKVKKDLEISEL